MNAGHRSHPSGDRGAALPLVLGFIVLVGTITVALLAQAGTSLRASRVSREHDAKVYAAGSALDWAIQQLRADPTSCASDGATASLDASALEQLPDAEPGRFKIEVTCTATGGASVGASGWSIFTTRASMPDDPSAEDWSLRTQGAANSMGKHVAGPVYNAGEMDLQADLVISDGFFRQQQLTDPCPGRPSELVVPTGIDVAAFYRCLPAIEVPDPVRSLDELTDGNFAVDPPVETIDGCRVFSPGRYTAAPAIAGGTTYFRPGVYLLDNVSLTVANATVVAGTEPDGDLPEPILSACPDAVTTRNGVTFLLAGSSSVSVDAGHLEVHGFYPNGTDGRPTVGIMELDDATAVAWGATVGGPLDEPAVQTGNGQGQQLVVSGNVYLTRSGVRLRGNGTNEDIRLIGGVVARWVDLQASKATVGSLFIATSDSRSARIVDVSVKVELRNQADQPIGRAVDAVATIFIYNDADRSASVSAWRIDEDTIS